ncbi:hypothetical protein T08_6172 [Trichinella sp. T8]|nr:hypothetical protein T08_6172 [Trichinella sp. T8]
MIVRRRRFGFDRRVRVSGHTVRLAASDPATPFPLDVPGSIYGQSVTIEACPGICAEGNRKCLLRHTASQGREMESTEKPEYFFCVTGIPSSRQAVSVRPTTTTESVDTKVRTSWVFDMGSNRKSENELVVRFTCGVALRKIRREPCLRELSTPKQRHTCHICRDSLVQALEALIRWFNYVETIRANYEASVSFKTNNKEWKGGGHHLADWQRALRRKQGREMDSFVSGRQWCGGLSNPQADVG